MSRTVKSGAALFCCAAILGCETDTESLSPNGVADASIFDSPPDVSISEDAEIEDIEIHSDADVDSGVIPDTGHLDADPDVGTDAAQLDGAPLDGGEDGDTGVITDAEIVDAGALDAGALVWAQEAYFKPSNTEELFHFGTDISLCGQMGAFWQFAQLSTTTFSTHGDICPQREVCTCLNPPSRDGYNGITCWVDPEFPATIAGPFR